MLSLMSNPVVMGVKKNSLRWHGDETSKRTTLKRQAEKQLTFITVLFCGLEQ